MRQIIFRENFGGSFFDNNVDLYEYIKSKENLKTWEHIETYRNTKKSWSGNVTYGQAMTNLQFGNKDITPQFIEGLRNLGHDTETSTGIFMNTEGFAYDMGAVVSGEPECCVDMKALEPKKTLKIVLDWTASAGVEGRNIINRGIALVNLIYTLMSKGYIIDFHLCRVAELNFTGTINGEDVDKHLVSIRVPTETLTIGTLGFYCSLEFFRIIMILAESMMVDAPYHPGDLHGTMCMGDYMLDKDIMFISSFYMDENAEKRCSSLEGATEYITGIFNKYCQEHNLKEEF